MLTILDENLGDFEEYSPGTHHPMKQQRPLGSGGRTPGSDAILKVEHVYQVGDQCLLERYVYIEEHRQAAAVHCLWTYSRQRRWIDVAGPGRDDRRISTHHLYFPK